MKSIPWAVTPTATKPLVLDAPCLPANDEAIAAGALSPLESLAPEQRMHLLAMAGRCALEVEAA